MQEVLGVYRDTITVFNYHAATGRWFPSVISGADLLTTKANSATTVGGNNADAVDIIVHCTADKRVPTGAGMKSYTGPKGYARCDNPAQHITFAPECDFIFAGAWPDAEPLTDDDYDEGLYHALNAERDGIYLISSAGFYGLLPHFEIGGR